MKTSAQSDLPKAYEPNTPKPTQNRILEEHLQGKSNRQIEKITGLNRDTVSRILSQPEMVEIIEEHRSQVLLKMGSKIVSVIEKGLDSDDLRISVPTAIKLAEATGILRKYVPVPASEQERDRQHDQDAAMGQMMQMVLDKSVRYSMPLPARVIENLRWIQNYAKETLEVCDGGRGAAVASTEVENLDAP